MPDVVVAGHLCLDIIAGLDAESAARPDLLAPGSLTMLEHGTITTGGVVANSGLAFCRLGTDVGLMARLGDDAMGYMTRQLIVRHDPRLVDGLCVVPGESSGYTIVVNGPGRERSFLVLGGSNDRFGPDDLDVEMLASARVVHVGYPPLLKRMYTPGDDCLVDVLTMARRAGATTSLDLAMPDPTSESGRADWPAILARVLPLVDLFVPSLEELLFTLQRKRYDALVAQVGVGGLLDAISWAEVRELGDRALDLGAQVLFCKMGPRGGYLATGENAKITGRGASSNPSAWQNIALWAPCYQVELANAVGAGDAAVAGFITALLHGMGPAEALLAAMAVGACNVEQAGGANGVLSWHDTLARMAVGWPQHAGGEPDVGAWAQECKDNGASVWHCVR